MQRATNRQRIEFVALLGEHIPMQAMTPKALGYGLPSLSKCWLAQRLLRYGATLGRLAEEQCNGYQKADYSEDVKRREASVRKQARIEAKVTDLCAQFGCTAVFQGDPRGCVLKIAVPDGFTNDMGREGICVPTS